MLRNVRNILSFVVMFIFCFLFLFVWLNAIGSLPASAQFNIVLHDVLCLPALSSTAVSNSDVASVASLKRKHSDCRLVSQM